MRFVFALLTLLFTTPAWAVTDYPAQSGNWTVAATWTSGSVPTAAVDVLLNNTYNVQCNTTCSAKSIDMTGGTGFLNQSSGSNLFVMGSVTLAAGLYKPVGTALMIMNSTGTLTTAGNNMSNFRFNKTGEICTLGDDFNSNSVDNFIVLINGTIDTNNVTISTGRLASDSTVARTWNLTNSTIYLGNASMSMTFNTTTNLVVNAGTSNIILNSSGNPFINTGSRDILFNNISRIGTAAQDGLILASDVAMTGNLVLTGNNVTNRLWVRSNTFGTPRLFGTTDGTVIADNVDFQDINLFTNITNFSSINDTTLRGGGYANIEYGNTSGAICEEAGSNFLVKTSLSGITASSISVANLWVYDSARGIANTLSAARLLKDWNEYNATFNKNATGVDWTTAGAAADGTDYTSTNQSPVRGNANAGWINFNVTLSARDMVGSNNYGWRIYAPNNNYYDTLQTRETAFPPYLIVYRSTLDFSANSTGDCGGATGATFTSAEPQFWNSTTGGNWSNASKWSNVSDGGAGRTPLPQDDALINASFSASQSVSADLRLLGKSIDWTGATGSPTFSLPLSAYYVFGSFTLINGMTIPNGNVFSFHGRGSNTLDAVGKIIGDIVIYGTYTLLSNIGADYYIVSAGNFNSSSYNISVDRIDTSVGAVTDLGTGNHTLTSYGGNLFRPATTAVAPDLDSCTIIARSGETSTLFGTSVPNAVFHDLIVNSTAFNLTINGNNTYDKLIINGSKIAKFTSNTTHTIGEFHSNGTAGNIVQLMPTVEAYPANLTDTTGTNYAHYTNISNITAMGGATWDATDNCVNVSNANGWTFTGAVAAIRRIFFIE